MGSQSKPRRDRAHAAWAGLIILAITGLLAIAASFGADIGEPRAASVQVRDARTCAAVAVYTTATADDWAQRAAIANANLNLFTATGVPDCFPGLADALGEGLDEYRWQASLDAVDAVSSGSYALPLACTRADAVIPLTELAGLPPSPGASSARGQCVLSGLLFWEQQA